MLNLAPEDSPDTQIRLCFCRSCETLNGLEFKRCYRCHAQLGEPTSFYSIGAQVRERYKIVRLLGIGEIGVEYQATDLFSQRYVALKFIHPHLLCEKDSLERLQQKAIEMSFVDHPHALEVLELDISEFGSPVLVTEFLEGNNLGRCLRQRERFTLPRIVTLLSQALEALHFAHQSGILHGAIKPQNLFIIKQNGEEQLRLIDFGLTQLLSPAPSAASLAYLSPEQLRREALDVRSDLWSIGVVLYQLMTGNLPFEEGTPEETAKAIIEKELPFPKGEGPTRRLWTICERVLSKNKERRPESAAVLHEELEQLLTRSQSDNTPGELVTVRFPFLPMRPKPSRWSVLVFGLGAASAAAFFYTQSAITPSRPEPEAPPTQFVVTAKELAMLKESTPIYQPEVKQEKPEIKTQEKKEPNDKTPTKALSTPPGQSKFTHAKALVLSGKYKDAAHLLQEVVHEEPGNASAHRWLGDALHKLGRDAEAKKHWGNFIRLEPNHPDAQRVKSRIESL